MLKPNLKEVLALDIFSLFKKLVRRYGQLDKSSKFLQMGLLRTYNQRKGEEGLAKL